MSDYHKLMTDDINYALEANIYLNKIQHETNKEKRFQILKKYFTEAITKNLYQNMDLLNSTLMSPLFTSKNNDNQADQAELKDFSQFKSMYVMIAKDLILNVLLAVNTLVTERGIYNLDSKNVGILSNIIGQTNSECVENEYSICEKCIMSSDF